VPSRPMNSWTFDTARMNQAEVVAQAVVEAVIQGSRMVYHPDQSGGLRDFDLHYPDGRVVALEVTESVDAVDIETQAAIGSRREGGPRVRAKLCRKAWRVHPQTGANIKRFRRSLDRYLARIESIGIEQFFSASDRQSYPAVESIYEDLQVCSGEVCPGLEPGFISIALPTGGGYIGSSLVSEAVELEASKPDNRRKLSAARTSEAHLFVFVDVLNRAWIPLVDLAPPAESPDLPAEITHVWAVGPAKSGGGYVVWRASAKSNWHSLGTVPVQLPTSG
jgi:hypothetical protein